MPAAKREEDLATLILTLLSVADDDRSITNALSTLAAETPRETFSGGMQEAARRIGVLFGAAQRIEVTQSLSINRLPV